MSLLRGNARVVGPSPARAIVRRGERVRPALPHPSTSAAVVPRPHLSLIAGSSRGVAKLAPPHTARKELKVPGAPPDAILYPLHDSELTRQQRDTFRVVHPRLVQALYQEDLHDAKLCWDTIVADGLLGLIRPHSWKELSSALVAYGAQTPQRWDNTAELAALDEIGVQAAARGCDDGLCARMRYYIAYREPGPVIRLFSRTCVMNKQRDAVYHGQYLAPAAYAQLIARHGRRTMVPPSTICHALTAFAQKGDFALALRAFLHPTVLQVTLFDHGAMCREFPATTEDSFLMDKATRYSFRLHLAILLMLNSQSFSVYIERMSTPQTGTQLLRFLYRTLEELNNPDSFIAYRKEDVSDKKPVLLDEKSDVWGMLLYAAMLRQHPQLVKKLQDSIKKAGLKIPGKVLGQMLRALVKLEKFDEVHMLWNTLTRSDDVSVDVDACTSYISALFDARGEKAAVRYLDEVEDAVSREVLPPETQPVYNAVIERLARLNKIDEVYELFERMRGVGIEPNLDSYNILLRHFVRTGQVDSVKSTFSDLEAAGVSGDVESYCLLLGALDSAPTTEEPALHTVLAKMKDKPEFEGIDDKPVIPVRMFKYLTQPGGPVEAEHAVSLAWDLMQHIDARGWPIWTFVFVRMLAAVERMLWRDPALPQKYRDAVREKAARLAVPMFRQTVACVDIVKACLENPEPAAARRAWDYYREHMAAHANELERAPNLNVWIPLLNGFRLRSEWQLADQLLQEIESHGEILTVGLLRIISLVRLRESANIDEYDLDNLKTNEEAEPEY